MCWRASPRRDCRRPRRTAWFGGAMSFNLATILQETATATPDAIVCRAAGSTTTYRQLDEQSGRFAAGLAAAGLSPGQVVAIQLPNVPEFLTAYFGALKA